ncbi:hypothetical protein AB0G74_28470 [Streptomyces sp. NPDC020875]|uniref:hypothetical protein n=1 Tax=Streptomyces sp. NPDC020875 TaxID=3154898 RepID=UPI0033F589A6
MGLFSRKTEEPSSNPAMTELGREFAIARRHGDRKTMRRIGRQYSDTARTDTDAASFQRGQQEYDSIPPVPRFGQRRRRS